MSNSEFAIKYGGWFDSVRVHSNKNMESRSENPQSSETPESQIVIFALEKLKEESAKNEGIWGIINRRRLSSAIDAVKKGKLEGSLPLLSRVVDRYEDFSILDYQLGIGGGLYLDRSENPFKKKVEFFGTVAVLVELDLARRGAAEGGRSIGDKQEIEKLVEGLLTGKMESGAHPNQQVRLLDQLNQLKAEIWPQG